LAIASGRKIFGIVSFAITRTTANGGIMSGENPVRAALAQTAEEWPWQGEINVLRW
jgi:hypothetical protein